MKTKSFLILSFLLIGLSSIYAQNTITVTEAGINAYNGSYTESGTLNGKARFGKDGGTEFIEWNGSQWLFGYTGTDRGYSGYFHHVDDTTLPPREEWQFTGAGALTPPELNGDGAEVLTTITLRERAVLIALYNSTNGDKQAGKTRPWRPTVLRPGAVKTAGTG